MKKVRIGFAAVVALLAMSFTIASHSNVKKRVSITNCYKTITTANYMSTCANPPIFTAITCSNKSSALGQALQNNLTLSDFSTTSVTCSGTTNLCCINLKSTTTNPCSTDQTSSLQKGGFKDFNNSTIAGTAWVLINNIECKD